MHPIKRAAIIATFALIGVLGFVGAYSRLPTPTIPTPPARPAGPLLTSPPTPPAAELTTDAELHRWMDTFYQFPRPEQVLDFYKRAAEHGWLDRGQDATTLPVAAFLAQILHHDPRPTSTWLDLVRNLPVKRRYAMWYAVWMAGGDMAVYTLSDVLDEAAPADRQTLAALFSRPPYNPAADDPTSQTDLDMLMATYSATDDEQFLIAFIAALPRASDGNPPPQIPALAEKLLIARCTDDPYLLERCKARVDETAFDFVAALQRVIAAAEQARKAGTSPGK
jgi:hypothetical protein